MLERIIIHTHNDEVGHSFRITLLKLCYYVQVFTFDFGYINDEFVDGLGERVVSVLLLLLFGYGSCIV